MKRTNLQRTEINKTKESRSLLIFSHSFLGINNFGKVPQLMFVTIQPSHDVYTGFLKLGSDTSRSYQT